MDYPTEYVSLYISLFDLKEGIRRCETLMREEHQQKLQELLNEIEGTLAQMEKEL